jgi:hypothetical protein
MFIYNCIFGRPTLTELETVTYIVHLKVKYHNQEGKIVTIHANLSGVRRLYEALRARTILPDGEAKRASAFDKTVERSRYDDIQIMRKAKPQ